MSDRRFEPKTCKRCKVEFRPRSGIQRFCTIRCRSQWHHAKNPRRAYLRTSNEAKRRYSLKSRFGLTVDDFDAMVERQGGVCAICSNPETLLLRGEPKRLSVDHSHESGQIRALLCNACNVGLGRFRDNPNVLRAAADYLEHHAKLQEGT